MIGSWYNNRISEKLNKEYPKDFSLSDIDGCVRCHYKTDEGEYKIRFIIYESKNEKEKYMGESQHKTLSILDQSINWDNFDEYSGLYIIKIIDIDKKLEWYNIERKLIMSTTFQELYNIFSCKEHQNKDVPRETLPEVLQEQPWMLDRQ